MIEYNVSEQTEIPEANGFSVKIIGVGGSGANVLDRMALEGSEAGDLLTINTDVRALSTSVSSNKIQLGKELLMGMGAGGDPELGREASLEAEAEIRDAVRGYSMVFVCVGLGGGTGSGAAPEVCRIAREEGAFLVAFTSLPFGFEGKRRMEQATDALKGIGEYANAVVTFENDRMGELLVAKEGIQQAFAAADKLISQSILATTNMVTQPGIIRLGMDDLLTALRNRDSRCLFGFGLAKGDNRAQEALAQALKSPLIDKTYLMDSAENVLIHISGGDSLTLYEVEILMGELAKHVSDQAQILFGVGTDKKLGNSLAVTLISSVSSEKIGPVGSRKKKEEDKKKALTKGDSGSDDDGGDDDGSGGGGGGSAKPGKSSAKVEAKGGADAAPPPPDVLELNAEPGAELQVEDEVDEPEVLTDSGVSEEIEKTEAAVGDDEESVEISSAAATEAADEISTEEEAEEVATEESDEVEVEVEDEDEVGDGDETEQDIPVEQESFDDDSNDEQEDDEEILDEEVIDEAADEEVSNEVEIEAGDLPSGLEEEISEIEEELKSIEQQIEKFDEAEELDSETLIESGQDLDDEPETEEFEEAPPELEPESIDEVEEPELIEDEDAAEDLASTIEEIDEVDEIDEVSEDAAAEELPEEAVSSQGMASLLGLTPVNVGEDSDEDVLPADEPDEEQEDLEADVELEEVEAEVSPFEIDDEEEDEGEQAEVEPEVVASIEKDEPVDELEEGAAVEPEPKKSSLPMSIRDLAKKSMQDQQSGQADDELVVHALDEPDDDDESDEDEETIVFGDDEEGSEGAVNVADVILSAAAGDDGDQEITLSRVDSPEEEVEEVAEEEAEAIEGEEQDLEVEQADVDDFPDLVKGEPDDEKSGKSGAQKQGVLELEPTAKGRFAKTDPTIVEGQDLDVPTFLRARRD